MSSHGGQVTTKRKQGRPPKLPTERTPNTVSLQVRITPECDARLRCMAEGSTLSAIVERAINALYEVEKNNHTT